MVRVVVTDIFEGEVAVEPNEPASQSEQQLGEWRVHVEVIFAQDVVGREFAKMNLVKAKCGL